MAVNGHRQADLMATLNSVAFFTALGYADGPFGEAELCPDVTFRWLDMSKALVPVQSALAKAV